VIEAVSPVVDHGRQPAKASLGAPVVVIADVFADGHEHVAAAVRYRRSGERWTELAMEPLGNDRWSAAFEPHELGRWEYDVIGWLDEFSTWRHGFEAKLAAAGAETAPASPMTPTPTAAAGGHHGGELDVDAQIGVDLLLAMAERANGDRRRILTEVAADVAQHDLHHLDDPDVAAAIRTAQPRKPTAKLARRIPLRVERARARTSAWYEFFPRSTVADGAAGDRAAGDGEPNPAQQTHGSLRDAIDRLDHIAAMGFDVVYLPPVHPIGRTNRKGPDNALRAGPDDPGSPWAIGSSDGGHTSVHPALGTVDDVAALSAACRERGMELALDIAFQCSPDHPWVTEHPTWFRHRPDGTIQYAENPPKRYQDIYPLDFATEDWEDLWRALHDVFVFWLERGVEVFRVDNPHTKALPFWEWVLPALHDAHPQAVFLAEAFTRPRLMHRLAKVGFSQSYTYFTWRQSGAELAEYLRELATESIDFLRPNFWPNTPDILTDQLQHGGRAAFVSRAILAATLSPNWGVYGPAFELGEHVAVRPGSEEYAHSEKYEVRHWDLDRPGSLAPLLTRLNRLRRDLVPLQHFVGLHIHQSDDPALFVFSKTDPHGVADPVLVVVNLDTDGAHGATVDIDWGALGLPYDSGYQLVDHLGGQRFDWHGARNYVELAPWGLDAHVFSVRSHTGSRTTGVPSSEVTSGAGVPAGVDHAR
jgi:starch synthase (maltosyl-transferring)